MSETPRVGDRVRATYREEKPDHRSEIAYEGVVTKTEWPGYWIGEGLWFSVTSSTWDWEILERAKPKWQNGDVASYGVLAVYYLIDGKWLTPDGVWINNVTVDPDEWANAIPLVPVLRDGKPVTP